MIKLLLGVGMYREHEMLSSRLIWELSVVLKCQGTQNNETGFVVVTYLYEHILAGLCLHNSVRGHLRVYVYLSEGQNVWSLLCFKYVVLKQIAYCSQQLLTEAVVGY